MRQRLRVKLAPVAASAAWDRTQALLGVWVILGAFWLGYIVVTA